ncbi:MAG: energy-coupling factor transporter transmembrane protein EcfT [Bacilli bacterium]|nr:energy-coupling factor transporter transmembrane protein EcfT [Bacilli bacterium]
MNSVFGKFTPYNTIIHRLDPRVKIISLIALMVMCFLPYGNYTNRFIILGVLFLIILLIMLIGRVSFISFLKSLRHLWFMMLFLVIIFALIPQAGDVSDKHVMIAFENGYTIYWEGLLQTLHISFRLALMLSLTLILTSTTSPMDLTYAFEWFLTPLRLIKFPTQIISMTLSLALRFIPTLLAEANKIMKAQKSRGVDYQRGFIGKKIKSVTTLIVPLLVGCFSRSDELSLAMNARGYEPYEKRTSYNILVFGAKDVVAIFSVLIIIGGFSTLCYFTQNVAGFDDMINLIFGVLTF